VRLLDPRTLAQVGDRPRHAQDAMDRATTELQPLGSRLEQRLTGGSQRLLPQLRAGESAVQWTLGAPSSLALARPQHAIADDRTRFRHRRAPQQLARRLTWNQDLEIDPVSDRSGQPGPIPLAIERGALANPAGVAGEAAGARVGRRYQDETARQHGVPAGAGHGQPPLLERLSQRLERIATELGDLVHEEHATVGASDFARSGRGETTAD
jgi:hypothetical protein